MVLKIDTVRNQLQILSGQVSEIDQLKQYEGYSIVEWLEDEDIDIETGCIEGLLEQSYCDVKKLEEQVSQLQAEKKKLGDSLKIAQTNLNIYSRDAKRKKNILKS